MESGFFPPRRQCTSTVALYERHGGFTEGDGNKIKDIPWASLREKDKEKSGCKV